MYLNTLQKYLNTVFKYNAFKYCPAMTEMNELLRIEGAKQIWEISS